MKTVFVFAVAALVALPAVAQTAKKVTMPPLSMTGLGTPPASSSSLPFQPKTVSMPALAMTGLGSQSAAPSAPFQPKKVVMPPLAMTGLGEMAPATTAPTRTPVPRGVTR